jgi:CRP-like cAMP-binding protein
MRTRQVRRGEYIYFEDQAAEHLWAVRSGEVRTLRTSASGRITTLELVRPGGLFGMAAVVEDSHYTDSAQAVAAGEVLSVRQKTIAAVLRDNPEAGNALLRIVARRLQNAHDRLCSFANDSVTARLAQTLLDEDEPEGDRIKLTRRILGESAGTTVETTIRILRGFDREGWIEGGVGWIRILDRAALEATAQDDKTK